MAPKREEAVGIDQGGEQSGFLDPRGLPLGTEEVGWPLVKPGGTVIIHVAYTPSIRIRAIATATATRIMASISSPSGLSFAGDHSWPQGRPRGVPGPYGFCPSASV